VISLRTTIDKLVERIKYQDTALFLIWIRSLLVDYQGVIDTLDIQLSLTIDDKIKYLQAKELRLQDASEQAHIASGPKYNRLRRTSSNSSLYQLDPDRRKKHSCDLCNKEDDFVHNCPDMKRAAKFLQSYKRNQKNLKKHTQSKMTPTDHFNDHKLAKNKNYCRSKKSEAYIAD
jgi:hypothetical protein